MTYGIVVLPQAKADAAAIYDYLAERNPSAADNFVDKLMATLLQASMATPGSPWISHNPATADLRWTRVKDFKNYLVFFRVKATTIEVSRILHGARDLEGLLV